ncbi:MAG: DUF512 domain-containing protein [Candidatus Muiribacteriota bacterium]
MKQIILPVTSKCNLNCIFCSHKGNPPSINIRYLKKNYNPLEKASKIFNSNVIIGESASKIVEGEPFIFKHIFELIKILIQNSNKVEITTSASLLSQEKIIKLSEFKDYIYLNISVNSTNQKLRKKIMGEKNLLNIKYTLKKLDEYNIKYCTSLVALNLKDNYDYIFNSLCFLKETQSEFTKIFIPGFTKIFSPEIMRVNVEKLKEKILPLRKKLPLIIEPQKIPPAVLVEGIIKNTPAFRAGLEFGDEILKINNEQVFSKSETIKKINCFQNPEIEWRRGEKKKIKKIFKQKGESSGILCIQDIDKNKFDSIKNGLNKNNGLILSEFNYDFFKSKLKKQNLIKVKNSFFGGNIQCNGLLTVSDIQKSLRKGQFNNVLLNPNFLDENFEDITGQSIYSLVISHKINPVF